MNKFLKAFLKAFIIFYAIAYSLLLFEVSITYLKGEDICHYSLYPVTTETVVILIIFLLLSLLALKVLKKEI